ncbi:hypothetical protein GCM10010446_20600 [Streptomyces enissocaesilis]|uniref:Uncharacterized protein n=1 Tax=Streptomyces enissocaesilis TaxID=332589 RepID=A0ABN3X2G8_9ACTN
MGEPSGRAFSASSADMVLAGSPGLPGATTEGPAAAFVSGAVPPPASQAPRPSTAIAAVVATHESLRARAELRRINTATSWGMGGD